MSFATKVGTMFRDIATNDVEYIRRVMSSFNVGELQAVRIILIQADAFLKQEIERRSHEYA